MRRLIYDGDEDGLQSDAYDWFYYAGLKETLWIIDKIWIIDYFDNPTFNQWTDK